MIRRWHLVGRMHGRMVHRRRVLALTDAIVPLLQPGWRVLDVGCGDGRLARLIGDRAPQVSVEGVEIRVRNETAIPVMQFDGRRLPFEGRSVDAVMLVDVLHHATDPMALLGEATRVARSAVVVKDHRLSRVAAKATLRFMDWAGNRPYGVALPYNYWSEEQWEAAWQRFGLRIDCYQTCLGLYPPIANWLFERGLHFLAKLSPAAGR